MSEWFGFGFGVAYVLSFYHVMYKNYIRNVCVCVIIIIKFSSRIKCSFIFCVCFFRKFWLCALLWLNHLHFIPMSTYFIIIHNVLRTYRMINSYLCTVWIFIIYFIGVVVLIVFVCIESSTDKFSPLSFISECILCICLCVLKTPHKCSH